MNSGALRYADSITQRLVDSIKDVNEWPSEAVGRAALVEATALIESTCGAQGHFSRAIHRLDEDNSVVWPYKGKLLLELIKSFTEHLKSPVRQARDVFVSAERIEQLGNLPTDRFDTARLLQLCREINVAYSHRCFLATAALLRAILDHIPPVFDAKDFATVANNTPFPKSVKATIQNLDGSLRNIADAVLHRQIGRKEVLPTVKQVSFQADLDVLLAQVVERFDTNNPGKGPTKS